VESGSDLREVPNGPNVPGEAPTRARVHTSAVDLPVNPPVAPMLSKRIGELPGGAGWTFEPKWDGFRVLVFKDGDDVLLQSRDEKPLNRYFPELFTPLHASVPARCVLDGEIVVARGETLDFEALQLRIHPAKSRVALLSKEIPASIVCFDMLCDGQADMRRSPFRERRRSLEAAIAHAAPPIHLTPATTDRRVAEDWFRRFEGAGLDGVMVKGDSGIYEPGKRTMLKVKHERECDAVVAGFRWHKNGEGTRVGSLLLGLYDDAGRLEHVGVCASFTDAKRRELVHFLSPYRERARSDHPWRDWADAEAKAAGEGRRLPGAQSRWSQGKDSSWEPLRPELVIEVAYDHMEGTRFRHTAQFRRWRTDKSPRDCTFAQLEVVPPEEVARIFGTGG